MTTDIPPGPARVAGMGIVTLARMSGRPIVPVAVATGRFFALPTWSRLTINLPFTKLAMVVGDPIYVPRDADEEAMEALRQEVEAGMNAATERAYKLAGSDARKTAPKTAAAAPPLGVSALALPRRDIGGAPSRNDDFAQARGTGQGGTRAPSRAPRHRVHRPARGPAVLVSCGKRWRDQRDSAAHARAETALPRAQRYC